MKALSIVMLRLVSLALIGGCAQSAKVAGQKAKCPACGYSFTIPDTPGN